MLALHSPDTPAQPPIPYTLVHKFQIALAPGDILVLTTDERDEEHWLREKLYPVSLLHILQNPDVDHRWRVMVDDRQMFRIQATPVAVHRHLNLSLTTRTVKHRYKGDCTIFTVEVAHGYRLHFLDFVKNRLPGVYAQLNLS